MATGAYYSIHPFIVIVCSYWHMISKSKAADRDRWNCGNHFPVPISTCSGMSWISIAAVCKRLCCVKNGKQSNRKREVNMLVGALKFWLKRSATREWLLAPGVSPRGHLMQQLNMSGRRWFRSLSQEATPRNKEQCRKKFSYLKWYLKVRSTPNICSWYVSCR